MSGKNHPLPWRVEFSEFGGYDSMTSAYYIKSASGRIVCDLDTGRKDKSEDEPTKALAEMIVSAVNNLRAGRQ